MNQTRCTNDPSIASLSKSDVYLMENSSYCRHSKNIRIWLNLINGNKMNDQNENTLDQDIDERRQSNEFSVNRSDNQSISSNTDDNINLESTQQIEDSLKQNEIENNNVKEDCKLCIAMPTITQQNESVFNVHNKESYEGTTTNKIATNNIDDIYIRQKNINNSFNDLESINKSFNNGKSCMRHVVVLLALSSIILANMNRQAFNVSMPNMIRNKPKPMMDSDNATNRITQLSSSCPWPIKELPKPDHVGGSSDSSMDIVSTSSSLLIESTDDHYDIINDDQKNVDQIDDDDRFDWTGKQTGQLQSAFSWGYAPFMIFGGRLSELYGAKWIVLISGLGSALCCLLTPMLADQDYYLLLASRVLMGVCQTGVSPALYALCARWLPPEESSIYLPLIKVGVMIGMFSGALISGFLSWRMTFYVNGLIGLVWSIVWMIYVTSDPSDHKMVNQYELDYIIDKIQELNKGRKLSAKSSRNKSAPWFNIITNRVVIVFMMTKFTVKLATDTQSIELPMYLSNVFHVDKEVNGLLTSINFGIQGLLTGLVAWLAKEMVMRKTFGLSKTGVRKLFQSICQFGCGFSFILVSLNGCNINIVMVAIILTSIACMFGSGGEAVIPIDLSNDYPASIMALANSLANLSGVLLPLIAFNILGEDVNNKDSWNYVWSLVGFISIGGGLLWLFFVEAKLQDFSRPCLCCNSFNEDHNGQNSTCDSIEHIKMQSKSTNLDNNNNGINDIAMIDLNTSKSIN